MLESFYAEAKAKGYAPVDPDGNFSSDSTSKVRGTQPLPGIVGRRVAGFIDNALSGKLYFFEGLVKEVFQVGLPPNLRDFVTYVRLSTQDGEIIVPLNGDHWGGEGKSNLWTQP
jgi:hypothetical protein